MAYFNHAFKKTFICTGAKEDPTYAMIGGLLDQAGIGTEELADASIGLGPGTLGVFDGEYYESYSLSDGIENCCKILIAGAAIKAHDMQGMHGGYQESSKSKIINPKYVTKFYGQRARAGNQAIVSIGGTPYNNSAESCVGEDLCHKEFICGETYYLRIDVKGTDALRFAHHNLYRTLGSYAGCCEDPATPTAVDPALIYGQWAQQIANDPYLQDFVMPILQVSIVAVGALQSFYATAEQATADGAPGSALISDYLADPAAFGGPADPLAGDTAGIQLVGAYVDTVFGNCTFQPTDYFGKNPIQLFASEVDLNGDPCEFNGLCVCHPCYGLMAEGLGEQVLRDLILSESYLQNFLATDLRVREITQGNQIVDIVDRARLYSKAYLLHSIPRFNNPSGTFDNDQYLVEVAFPTDAATGVGTNIGKEGEAAYEIFNKGIGEWLIGCGNDCTDVKIKADYECQRPEVTPVEVPPGPAAKKA